MTATLQETPRSEWEGKYIGTRPDILGRPQLIEIVTVQFASGGLLDAEPVEDRIHLNALGTERSDATLCGIAMFAPGSPGWSRGGGVTGPDYVHMPCPECRQIAHALFPGWTRHHTWGTFTRLDWSDGA